jgi:hypothetical protein
MSSQITYPILIIIFSLLVIYGIFNIRQNAKLIKGIEKYSNAKIKLALSTNTKFTRDIINGNWTCDLTTADSNYIASNLLAINILPQSKPGDPVPSSYGTIIYGTTTYNINFILNENITGIIPSSNQNIHIKLYNNFSSEEKIDINSVFNKPETFNSVVSLFIGNTIINKFASYKVYTDNNGANTVGGELYRIIKSNDIYINSPPSIYDNTAYDKIIGDYQFPPNFIAFSFGNSNTSVLNKINNNYSGNIDFCIQRVFYTPTDPTKEIITKMSPKISLSAVQNSQIPLNIFIAPFLTDKTTNKLNSFFKPKRTILYFYKSMSIVNTYGYSDPNMITLPNSALNLKNNAQSITNSNISFNNLATVEKIITNNYIITNVNGSFQSNLNDEIVIPFSVIHNLL